MDGAQILARAAAYQEETLKIYRWLHQHPEIAHEEIQTNRLIRQKLNELMIPYEAPAENITIAVIDSGSPGAIIGLRCDTDALPVQEETGLPFASECKGKMHACGHDAHTAIGLITCRLLQENKASWRGKVKVIFQPAEEGEAGAQEVLATGLVQDVDVFFGIHVWSPYASGQIHVAPVPVSATVDMFRIVIKGKGGHGATPEKCHDVIVAGAALVSALQTIVSRRISPVEPALLTIGSFHAGTAGNIIAPEAELKGTFRTLNQAVRAQVLECLEEMSSQICQAYGCDGQVFNRRLSDAVINDSAVTRIAAECAAEVAGKENVFSQKAMMLGDDFSDYGVIAPYCYGQIGIADAAKGTDYAHHNGKFRMDEEVFPSAIAWMTLTAMRLGEQWTNIKNSKEE